MIIAVVFMLRPVEILSSLIQINPPLQLIIYTYFSLQVNYDIPSIVTTFVRKNMVLPAPFVCRYYMHRPLLTPSPEVQVVVKAFPNT